jgi:hypothetical protein
MRSLIDRAVEVVGETGNKVTQRNQDESRAEQLFIRRYPDDRQLLAERAAARRMPSATYMAVVTRSHLRHLSPLP